MRVDETVFVSTNKGGEPVGFNWRGIAYLVKSRPLRWFARREWWVEASRVQRGVGANLVEIEMWRLQAGRAGDAAETSEAAQFELTRGEDDNVWRLVRVWR
ncbi:MAG: hypothetical protein ACKOQ8_06995 [Micrococcales bacterium]